MMMFKLIALLVPLVSTFKNVFAIELSWKDAKDRALETLQQMTLAEKISLM